MVWTRRTREALGLQDLSAQRAKARAGTEQVATMGQATTGGVELGDAYLSRGRSLDARLEQAELRFGVYATALFVALAVELFSFLLISRLTLNYHSFSRFVWVSENPFGLIPDALPEHRHRVLGPLIAYVLHLRGLSSLVVPLVANLALEAGSYVWLRRQRVRADCAWLAVLVLGTTLVVASNRIVLGFQDSLAAIGLLLMLASHNPALSAGFLLVFMFADERIVTGVPLVLFWRFMQRPRGQALGDFILRAACYGVAAAIALGLIHWIRAHTGVLEGATEHLRSTLEFGLFREQIDALGLGYFLALRGAWLLPALALLWLARRSTREAVLFGAGILLALPAASLIADVSRVAALCVVPALYISVALLSRDSQPTLRRTLIYALAINVLCPCIHTTGRVYTAAYALPFQLLRNHVVTGEWTLFLRE